MIISAKLQGIMIQHAFQRMPFGECCGIVGSENGVAKRVYMAINGAIDPNRYLIDPDDQMSILDDVYESGYDFGAIYHSHIDTEAFPSPEDIIHAYYPNVLYIIIGLRDRENPEFRGFHIKDGQVTEVDLNGT